MQKIQPSTGGNPELQKSAQFVEQRIEGKRSRAVGKARSKAWREETGGRKADPTGATRRGVIRPGKKKSPST